MPQKMNLYQRVISCSVSCFKKKVFCYFFYNALPLVLCLANEPYNYYINNLSFVQFFRIGRKGKAIFRKFYLR